MNGKKRFSIALVLGLMLAALVTSAALAFDCNNPNIDDHAVVGTFNVQTDTFTPNKANWGTFDKVHGAWVKLVLDDDLSFNIFVKALLPDGARDSGPGENGCDGKGIDDMDVCLEMYAP